MGRWAIYTVNGALVVFSCFLAANMFNQWMAERLRPPVEVPKVAAASPEAGSAQTADYHVILDRNLFKSSVIEQPVAAPAPSEDLAETKLPLRLLGTAAASDARRSTAALENTGSRKTQVVKVGEPVKELTDVNVVAIERKRIVLDNRGTREELKLEENLASAIRPAPAAARSRRPNDRVAALRDRLETLKEKQADRRSPSALFSQGRILPEYENGQMVGIKIDKIQPGGFYDKIGLTDGTVVTNVNDIEINSPSATKDILRALTEDETLTYTTASGETREVDASAIINASE